MYVSGHSTKVVDVKSSRHRLSRDTRVVSQTRSLRVSFTNDLFPCLEIVTSIASFGLKSSFLFSYRIILFEYHVTSNIFHLLC